MEVTYQNRPEDILAILKAMTWRDQAPFWRYLQAQSHVVWPSILLCVVLQEWYVLAGIVTLVVGILLLGIGLSIRERMNLVKTAKFFPDPLTVRLTDDFLEIRHEGGGGRRPWSYVRRVADRPEHLVLFIQEHRAHVVPKEYFSTPQEAAQFVAEAQRLHAAGQNRPLPLFAWEDFLRELEIEDKNLVQQLHWEHDPRLTARLKTLGLQQTANTGIASIWSLLQQLIMPLILAVVLAAMRYLSYSAPFGFRSDIVMYYLFLALAIIALVGFGSSLAARRQFRGEFLREQHASRMRVAWFYDHGVGTLNNESISFLPWQIFEQVADDLEAIVLYDRVPFIYEVIPKNVFPEEEQTMAFLERIRTCHEAARDQHDDTILAEVSDNPFQSPSSM